MRVRHNIIPAFCFVILALITVRAESWHGLIPLRSTTKDVERELGKPLRANDKWMVYEDISETVIISLSAGERCENESSALPAGTIIYIQLKPKSSTLRLADFGLDERQLQRFEPSRPGLTFGFEGLVDEKRGLTVRTQNRNIETIFYLGEKKRDPLCLAYYPNPRVLADVLVCDMCPAIFASSPDEAEYGSSVTFKLSQSSDTRGRPLNFKWEISGGRILEGQGTSAIKVDTKDIEDQIIVGRVDIEGLDPSCSSRYSSITKLIRRKSN